MSGIAITFPSSPIEGQSYLAQNGFTYVYDSLKNRWKRGGEFVRAPKVLSYAGVAVTTTGSGITTGPNGALIYNVPGFLIPNSTVGVDSFKAYRSKDDYPNYTEIQVSISSAFSSIAYAATFADTSHTIPATTLSGDTTYYLRARQFVGSNASAASTGAISGYSPNVVSFATTSVYVDTPTIVSIAATTGFPAYQIGFANTTLPATVTYQGSGVGNLQQVEWRVTGPRNPDSTGDTALAEVGIGTFSSATLANALVLAMPFSGATGVGITNDVNGAIRTASGASAGTTKTITAVGSATTVSVGIATTTSHFYPSAASFNGSSQYLTLTSSSDFAFGTGDFTIEGWIYPLAFNSYNTLASTRTALGTVSGFNLSVNSSGQLILYTNGFLITATASVFLKTWTHFAFVRKSNILNVYSNGILVGSTTITNDFTRDTFWIASTDGTEPFNGYFQDFKVYKGLAKYQENFTPPLPTYGTISYTTRTIGSVGVATTAFFKSTGDIPTAEVAIGSSTAAQVASSLVLAMPMNRTFGFQDINVAVRGLTSGASAGTAKTVGLGTTSSVPSASSPVISSTESKWYDGAAYFDGPINTQTTGADYLRITNTTDFDMAGDFTWECWAYPTQLPASDAWPTNWWQHSVLFGRGTPSTGDGWCLIIGATKLIIQSSDSQIVSGTHNIAVNNWYHLSATRSGSTVRIFVNGVLVGSATNATSFGGGSNFYIGGETGEGAAFVGYIQDLKIYKGLAKYTTNFTPPAPICGFTTDLAIQTGFTTTSATGVALTSIVGLGSTSTLAFGADQTYAGITSITSSSGITTLPDPYAQNLVLALPLANITGVGNSFTNDRNTQIRSVSITGAGVTAGTTKTITNTGVTTVSLGTTSKWYGNTASFNGSSYAEVTSTSDFAFSGDFTVECWIYMTVAPTSSNASYLTDFRSGSTNNFTLGIVDRSGPKIYAYANALDGYGSIAIPTNTWTHLAYSRQGSSVRLFVNGVLDTTATLSYSQSATGAVIGSRYTKVTEFWNGYIQDLRIYNGLAKYNTNFTPPPPMFGDYTRSTPNKIVFTPGSDYVLEARNTATGGIVTSVYSATRQWGTKPKGGIYDPYASNLVLAIPGGAVSAATSTYDVTGQIRYETPTASYVNAGIITYRNSLGIGTYGNKSVTNTGPVTISASVSKYYSRSMQFSASYLTILNNTDLNLSGVDWTFECWIYPDGNYANYNTLIAKRDSGTEWEVYLRISTGVLSYYNGTNYESSATPIANTWNHIAATNQNGFIRLFLNGIIVLSGNYSTNSGTNNVYIGSYPTYSEHFKGYMSDVRVYKGVAKYTSNFTPPNQIYLT